MISRKNIIATLLGLSVVATSYGQDLIHRVPDHASFVVVINTPAIVDHGSIEKIDEVFRSKGIFADLFPSDLDVESITDLDLSYERSAYFYKTDTDSSTYTGILLPLKSNHQVGDNLVSKLLRAPASPGYERRVSADGKTQVAWDANSIFILTGDARPYFFDQDSVAQRYGLELPDYSATNSSWLDYDYGYDTPVAVDTAYAAEEWNEDAYAIQDSVETAWTAYDFNEIEAVDAADSIAVDSVISIPDDYGYVYTDDTNSDDYYQKERARHAKNDSLRNAAVAVWLAQDFDRYLTPAANTSPHRYINKYDRKNTLIHFWARDMIGMYRQSLPYYMPTTQLFYQMERLAYAYQDIVVDLVQDKHTLKLQGSFGMDPETERIVKPIYKNKMNRKFANYIPENHIGYLSMNVSSEAYMKNFPLMLNQLYGLGMYASFGEIADIVVTALDIALDEKAIARVMGGDHVLFINDLKQVEKEYVDYEYDPETFEYNQITKTKEDYVPTFLWMFTSEDQRIYKKILELGESKEKVSQTNGIYKILDNPSDEIVYALFKDNIVFVSNDNEQLIDIQANRFRTSKDKQIKKKIYGNTMTAVTHVSKIPEMVNRLGIPVIKRWDNTLQSLSQYGDVDIVVQGFKKGRNIGELTIQFPKAEDNALQYLLQELLNNM